MDGDFMKVSYHVCRKEKNCSCCCFPILENEIYLKRVGKYQGDFFNDYWCNDCEKIINYWIDTHPQEKEFDYEGIKCDIQNEICEKCEEINNSCIFVNKCIWRCFRVHRFLDN